MNMLKKIRDFFDENIEEASRLRAQLSLERMDNEQLRRENFALKILADNRHEDKIPIVGFDDNDCEPADPVAREEYVKNLDFFYEIILEKKLKSMIADIREMLSNIHVATGRDGQPLNMQRNEYDWYLRGMESLAWKINEWANILRGERRQNLKDKENKE